jgi:tRNA (cmo5U34)-methyltransferase
MKQFDNVTPHLSSVYDTQILNTIPNYDIFHQEVIHLVIAANMNPKIWMDTGAGTGTLIDQCVGVFPETLFLLADPSEEMLGEAKQKLIGYGPDRVRFLQPVETQNLSLSPDLHPDVITAIQAHHYLTPEGRTKATKVCFDALNKGGMFITFENIRPFSEKGIEIGKQKWGSYQLSRGKDKEAVDKHLERFGVEYFPITIEEHLSLYRECGFEIVELLWFSYMQAGFYCIK